LVDGGNELLDGIDFLFFEEGLARLAKDPCRNFIESDMTPPCGQREKGNDFSSFRLGSGCISFLEPHCEFFRPFVRIWNVSHDYIEKILLRSANKINRAAALALGFSAASLHSNHWFFPQLIIFGADFLQLLKGTLGVKSVSARILAIDVPEQTF
jgi:hypothetical protein